ncbi:CPBP family intramembrane glutamic endopeptidase [Paraburkholderia fungorum]|uniref:CPBP family intramembrane glutamic endopeptidase n=1 Tax=Paraburkholderia fungorum TaxID=134537 RepID=UPI0038B833FC
MLESTFRSRSFAALFAAPTPVLILIGTVSIFLAQYGISVCLGGLFGYPAPAIDPFAGRPLWLKIPWIVVLAPLYETLIFQWLIIKFVHGPLRGSWLIAGLASAVIFGLGHGHTDWRAVRMLATAAVLASIFVIESGRAGPAFWATCITHGFFNGLTVVYNS